MEASTSKNMSVLALLISNPAALFSSINNNRNVFTKAFLLSVVISFIVTLLGVPSFRINNVEGGIIFFILNVTTNIMLFFIYSIFSYISAKVLLGNGGFFKSISAFLYTLPLFVFINVLEIPLKTLQDKELIDGKLTLSTLENMVFIISSDPYILAADLAVGIMYIWFACILFLLLKTVHNFGFIRSSLSSLLTLVLMYLSVFLIENPINHFLLTAFKSY
ncbi:YIP1 family protein [uncultured Shewanella sp.]|uniref:YIP1 family protein n=1 Tax=uncultured Shewanella sp. TaxID=173975 RepID=UPI0026288B11|nr:YIP1 family protein [uncultured Shewanella sp.]